MTPPPTLYIQSMKIANDLSNTAHDKKERFFPILHYIGAVLPLIIQVTADSSYSINGA